jgi:CMP-N,N'-diacetyllegionaminic acid synthase
MITGIRITRQNSPGSSNDDFFLTRKKTVVMSNLCIIPARGGSRGVPRKNLRVVAGKPLIAWTIRQAVAASRIDRIVVSTDDGEIADVARRYGAEVPFLRPAELATDTAPTEPVLIHVVDELRQSEGYRPKSVVLLQPTCPVRKAGSVDRAIARFEEEQADSLLSVREIHPFLWRDEVEPKALYDFVNRPRRQDVAAADRLFEETGSIYITDVGLLLCSKNRLGGKVALFAMEAEESWDIDTESDFAVAEALLTRFSTDDH